jgi:hypothetical protein
MSMAPTKTKPRTEPVECLMGIFSARRDLLEPLREAVMKGTPLLVDEGDIMVLLFGHRVLGWHDFAEEPDAFVPTASLREQLVHDSGRFSRRIHGLIHRGLAEIPSDSVLGDGRRKYVQRVRITEKGIAMVRPRFERYRKLASKLLSGVPQSDLDAHCRVNEAISAAIKAMKQNVWQL